MYMIWSSVRDNAHSELQPVMDARGNLFWDGDLWYLPLLIIFKPSAAKQILDARYHLLEHATRLAAGYGYEGSKYPTNGDVVGYGNNPYWDTTSALHIFNTGLISMNVWNYYRVSMDKLWLQNRGYEMLKSNADFFCSKMDVDEDGSVHLRGVCSMNGVSQDDNSLTNYMAKLAFQTAIEASFELQMPANPDWNTGYYGLDVTIGDGDILKESAELASEDTDARDARDRIHERLIPLLPMYSEVLFKTHPALDAAKVIRANVLLEEADGTGKTCEHISALNTMITAWLHGELYASSFPSPSGEQKTDFETSLGALLESAYQPPWRLFSSKGTNDVSLCAMFVLMLITTLGTVRIAGNVTETRFYTEKMGLRVSHASRMPPTWKSMRLSGVGPSKATSVVWNNSYT
jgi:hypothetical protein